MHSGIMHGGALHGMHGIDSPLPFLPETLGSQLSCNFGKDSRGLSFASVFERSCDLVS